MKLLVFTHAPSAIAEAQLPALGMIAALAAEERVQLGGTESEMSTAQCVHVNSRSEERLLSAGKFTGDAALLTLLDCARLIWLRFRFGVRGFYYVPAPPGRSGLYRDWLVLLICRPFFSRVIFHWKNPGTGDWLHQHGTRFERWLSHQLFERPALSISADVLKMRDALWFKSQRNCVVAEELLRSGDLPAIRAAVLQTLEKREQRRTGSTSSEPISGRAPGSR